jgi:predicted nuclease of predicted toxin-antitoxin system
LARFLLDENVEGILLEHLRNRGFDVVSVREAGLRGAPDSRVFSHAQVIDAVIVTADVGFANLLRFPLGGHSGIVVLRLRRLRLDEIRDRVLDALAREVPDAKGYLAIVNETTTRIRRA